MSPRCDFDFRDMVKYSQLREQVEALGVDPDKYAQYYTSNVKENSSKKKPEFVWDSSLLQSQRAVYNICICSETVIRYYIYKDMQEETKRQVKEQIRIYLSINDALFWKSTNREVNLTENYHPMKTKCPSIHRLGKVLFLQSRVPFAVRPICGVRQWHRF